MPTALVYLFPLLFIVGTLHAQDAMTEKSDIDNCLLNKINMASANTTVAELRLQCTNPLDNRMQKRAALERRASRNPFALLPHKPNYVLPVTVVSINKQPYGGDPKAEKYQDTEAKFQISLKYLALEDVLFKGLDLQFAFTLNSYWQSYNSEISAPFRETNYEPELILNLNKSWSLLGLPVEQTFLSLNHQSNGQTGQLSRSWNRMIAGIVFAHTNNVTWGVQTWWRIPEDAKENLASPDGDDNPDIEQYMGYGTLGAVWSISDQQSLELLFRNNLRSDNRGAVQLGWTFPITKHLRGYVEYFNGYGESLIYYNQHVQRLGLGVKLTNWL
ncbi:MAG: phospholipase A1 [Paraglaciecola sp.]|jgi:phospholipase A1